MNTVLLMLHRSTVLVKIVFLLATFSYLFILFLSTNNYSSVLISCTVEPQEAAGFVDIVVTNPDHQRSLPLQRAFKIHRDLRVTTVSLNNEPDTASALLTTMTPVLISSDGNDLVYIYGENFLEHSQVFVGGVPCKSVVFFSPSKLSCITNQAQPGVTSVIIKNRFLKLLHPKAIDFVKVEGLVQFQASSRPSHKFWKNPFSSRKPKLEQVKRKFGVYGNSEAHAFFEVFQERLRPSDDRINEIYGRHLFGTDFVKINKKKVDVSTIPAEMIRSYVIVDRTFAEKLDLQIGFKFFEKDLYEDQSDLTSDQIDELTMHLQYPRLIEQLELDHNPIYQPRVLSQEMQSYQKYLTSKVDFEIAALSKTVHNVVIPFQNPRHGDIANRKTMLDVVNNEYDQVQLEHLLTAIQLNNEDLFLGSLINLTTSLGADLAESRRAFVQTFITLFITKNFPSEGHALRYFHCVANCGRID